MLSRRGGGPRPGPAGRRQLIGHGRCEDAIDLEALPAEALDAVLDDVADVVGAAVISLHRLPGGVNGGALRVGLAGGARAVLKTAPAAPTRLSETLRAQRIVEHMRRRGYPTPAWLGTGTTSTHVWHLMELVDAAPVAVLTPSLVDQLMEVVELQAGEASEPYDHWSFAWRVITGREPALVRLSEHSSQVSALVERVRVVCADVAPSRASPDMVHADLNPSNVLVRGGRVVALVDIENAGSGTRATDLATILWHTFHDPLTDVRARLWTRILGVVGWDGAAVLAATQLLLQLQWRIRLDRQDDVAAVVERGHRVLDELTARG